jgi:DNA oxidative demethylase
VHLISSKSFPILMLFSSPPLQLADDVWLLKSFVQTTRLRAEICNVSDQASFRHYTVPGGQTMSVAMTSCGAWGWVSDERGYAYVRHDPATLQPWPVMPEAFKRLAEEAGAIGGWLDFEPDSCLINRYEVGAGLGLHQDRNERDLRAPIVSVSLGASCKFLLGGLRRADAVQSIELHDGDVMVWGGRSRLVFHGVRPLPSREKSLRYNLTLRRTGFGDDQAAS